MEAHSPVRVVLDRSLRLPVASALVQSARQVPLWLIAGEAAPSRREQLRAEGVEVTQVPAAGDRLDLASALRLLAGRGITRLMVEGGPILAAALVAADLVDEVVLFRSPHLIGGSGIDVLEGQPLTVLTRSTRLVLRATERLGLDTMETFERP
jgi:diaminohydroxyphosphoribosylaminopyrimidine deaminase/5-amino-6-(5-phosphoribosylamino)uracil reductase